MRFMTTMPITVALAIATAGCALRPIETTWPEPRPLGAQLPTYQAPFAEVPTTGSPSTLSQKPSGVLSLRQALSLALAHNPKLAVFSWEVRQGEARTLQAKLRPNPEVEIQFEDFGGSDQFKSSDALQTTLALSQLIELGGKRLKRTRLAAIERDLKAWDYEAARIDVFAEAARAFVEVLASQEQRALSQELSRLTEQVFKAISDRVEAGAASPVEATRAGVAVSISQIELARSQRALLAARKRLAATWGSSSAVFERVDGDLYALSPIPSLEPLEKRIGQNPDLARWLLEMEQRSAVLGVQLANRIPDVTLSGGIRRFNDTNDNALVAGFSIPLPVFNRNQGSIREAQYGLAKAREEQRSVEVLARDTLATAYEALSTSFVEATLLRDEVLPGARGAFDAITEGYRQGKFGYLEVLDAQQALFEARGRHLEALAAYHTAVADVERLIGESLETMEIKDEE